MQNGHIEGVRADGDSFAFSVYLYDEFEDYLAYLAIHGIYGFSNDVPTQWKDSKLYRVLGEASVRRIVSAIESMRAYA